MEHLSQLSRETVNLAVPRGGQLVQIDQVDSRYLIGAMNWVGVDVPAHCTALGKVLYESGAALRHIYFPTDSIVSLLYVMRDGASAEIAVVGREGAVGVSLFMGGETTPSRALVQSAGQAYRHTRIRLKQEFDRHASLLHVLLR